MVNEERGGTEYIVNSVTIGESFDNSVLQTLNRALPDGRGNSYFYPAEVFAASLEKLTGTPIIFSETGRHPDMALFRTNPEAALTAIKGRIVGRVSNPRIVTEGHPRLMGALPTTDQRVIDLYNAGKLSPSTGIEITWEPGDAGQRRIADIRDWNHILLFEETQGAVPNDRMAFIANTEANMAENEEKTLKEAILEFLAGLRAESVKDEIADTPEVNMAEPTPATVAAVANTEAIDESETLRAKVAELTNVAAEFEAYKAQIAQKEEDSRWAELKNTAIKPGMIDTEEKEAALREKWRTDKDGFYAELMNTKRAPATEDTGAEFQGEHPENIVDELFRATGRMR